MNPHRISKRTEENHREKKGGGQYKELNIQKEVQGKGGNAEMGRGKAV